MQPLDLTNCDREPIHIPGSIQPHGILLVVDPNSEVVLQAAGDTADSLATQHPPLGRPLHDLLGVGLEVLHPTRRVSAWKANPATLAQ